MTVPAGFTVLERCLTAVEVAEVLGVSKQSVYRAAASGELPAVKVGRSVRFYPSVVRAFLEGSMPSVSGGGVS